jgi:anti-sigma regulatory factor (Ser/Thr protein kinase)
VLFRSLKEDLCKIKGIESKLDNVQIVLGEIIQNIIRHGYKNLLKDKDFIELSYNIDNDKLSFTINDFAPPIDKRILKDIFLPSEAGKMGLNIIRQATCDFDIQLLANGNRTNFSFLLDNKA